MVATSPASVRKPAAVAAARGFGAGLGLGAFGLACSAFVLLRLVESWRVTAGAVSHHITVLGQPIGYPTANLDAVVVLALALLALIATLRAARCGVREATAAARLRRRLGRASLGGCCDALVIADERPLAFCAGLLRPRIYVSTGALTILDEQALTAVLDHERHHAQQRHPLQLAAARVIAESLFFVPGLRELSAHQKALAELSADECAVNAAPANRSALARAMLSFSDASNETHGVGFDPARVDYLLGRAPTRRFPLLVCVVAAAVLGLVVAVAFLAGQVATGSATLAPPVLSRQPCVLALALTLALLAFVAARCVRLVRSGRR